MGEQIKLRHSSLWRKSYQYEKPTNDIAPIRKQMNECIFLLM